jgi:hypothetical protein
VRSSGVAPDSAEYGFFRSVGEYTELQTSQASPYWSGAPHFGHVALDVAVRQEHALDRVEELLDRLRVRSARRPCSLR